MRDPQSEQVVEKLYQTRDEAKEVFKEHYLAIVEGFKAELVHDSHTYHIPVLEALYDRLNGPDKEKMTQTDQMLWAAAAVEILTAPINPVKH